MSDSFSFVGINSRSGTFGLAAFMVAAVLFTVIDFPAKPANDAFAEELLFTAIFGLLGPTVAFFGVLTYHVARPTRVRLSRLRAARFFAEEMHVDEKKQIKQWLSTMLGEPGYGVGAAHVFGSLTHDRPTRDVDVLIVFKNDSTVNVRTWRRRLMEIERNVQDLFGKPLHWQFFYPSEQANVDAFLRKAGSSDRLV